MTKVIDFKTRQEQNDEPKKTVRQVLQEILDDPDSENADKIIIYMETPTDDGVMTNKWFLNFNSAELLWCAEMLRSLALYG
jgi:hypothetical protein